MNNIYNLNESKTISDWIKRGKQLYISQHNIAFRENIDDIIIIFDTLITRFIGVLNDHIIDYELTDAQLIKYKQKPKLFSLDIYGTPELWSSILYINNMVSVTEFTKKRIKVFTSDIIDVIEELIVLYEKDLIDNDKRMSKVGEE